MTEQEQRKIFSEWIEEYKPLLFKVVRSYAFNLTDQDDLFQNITIQVWRSVPNFKGDSKVSTWLYRIALNTALNWRRKESRHQQGHQELEHHVHVIKVNPEEKDERLEWLYDQISRLEELDRSLTLLLLDGYSYKEMSDIIGISESNVGVKIHRIKKHLITQSKKV
jgi:RNA polymerase sigma-70 factor (ECF subfamily)